MMRQFSIATLIASQKRRSLLWVPVLLALGAAAFYALPVNPPLWLYPLMLLLAGLLLRYNRHWPSHVAALLVAGFMAAAIDMLWRDTVMIPEIYGFRWVEGRIYALSDQQDGLRVTLDNVTIEKLKPEETPKRIRVKLRGKHSPLLTGQRIRLRAGLLPPSDPVLPGAFNFSRHFYFQSIGAVGYAVPPVEIINEISENEAALWLNQLRRDITARIYQMDKGAAGAITAALMTGERAAIPDEIDEAMRISNLLHILSISGLHMALMCGFVYFTVRFAAVVLPFQAAGQRAKPIAAVVAMIAGGLYLCIAGFPAPAIRAYIMVLFMLMGVLLRRDPAPMRALMLAATAMILWYPPYVMQPGFQLSFIATFALIAFYEYIARFADEEYHMDNPQPWRERFWLYLFGIIMSSLVAQLATTPLIWYHFNQLTLYGLVANFLVSPLVSFLIMPAVGISFLLMPFGAEGLVLPAALWGVNIMIDVALWTSQLPHAVFYRPSPSDAGMVVSFLGLCWLLIWRRRVRFIGVPFMLFGLFTYLLYPQPQLLVSADGKQVAWRDDGGQMHMLRGTGRGFVAQQWARSATRSYARCPRTRPAGFARNLIACWR